MLRSLALWFIRLEQRRLERRMAQGWNAQLSRDLDRLISIEELLGAELN